MCEIRIRLCEHTDCSLIIDDEGRGHFHRFVVVVKGERRIGRLTTLHSQSVVANELNTHHDSDQLIFERRLSGRRISHNRLITTKASLLQIVQPTDSEPIQLLDGTAVAKATSERTQRRAAEFTRVTGRQACLVAVLVREDPASVTYVKMKQSRARRAGIESRKVVLTSSSTTKDVVSAVTALSNDPSVHGILLQHPVPHQVDERAAFEAISPDKDVDVDGVTMTSFARMAFSEEGFNSCTPGGILDLLDAYKRRTLRPPCRSCWA